MNKQRILVTGANGFIGKNLLIRLGEKPDIETLSFVRGDSVELLRTLVAMADVSYTFSWRESTERRC